MKSTFLRLIVTIFAVALLLCGVKVGSLSKIPTDAATKKPLSVTEAPLLTVPPEMEKLARALEGTWQVSEKLEPSNSLPNGGTGRGRVIYRQTAGGMALIEEYRSTGAAGEYQGAALFWWDEPARVYRPHGAITRQVAPAPQELVTGRATTWYGWMKPRAEARSPQSGRFTPTLHRLR